MSYQKVTQIVCTRCLNRFYTAFSGPEIKCPYCGYSIKVYSVDRRGEERAFISRQGILSKDTFFLKAQVSDISINGVCLQFQGSFPCEDGETVRISIKDFDIEEPARIIWVKRFDSYFCKAGLVFLRNNQ